VSNVLLLFHIDGKLKGTTCLYKMSFELVIDVDRLANKNVIFQIVVIFIVCYVFYTGRYAQHKDILCV
jgi:hypothetical protein